MKKKIIVILGFLMVLAIVWMGYKSVQKLGRKEAIENIQSGLHHMLKRFGRTDIKITPSTILIYFNSECEHCQWEMQEISKNIGRFKDHQLLFTSFEPDNEAIAFLNQYNLSNFYLKSTPEKVMSSFTGGVPQTLVYHDGRLIKHFKGEVKIEAILEVLQKE